MTCSKNAAYKQLVNLRDCDELDSCFKSWKNALGGKRPVVKPKNTW